MANINNAAVTPGPAATITVPTITITDPVTDNTGAVIAVLFFSGGGILSRLVEWGTRSPYSHVALALGDDVYEAIWPRVRVGRGTAARRGPEAALVIPVRATAEQESAARRFADAQIGDGYDLLDFCAVGLGLIAGLRRHWICSAFVAACLDEAGIRPCPDARAQTPASLAASLILEDPRTVTIAPSPSRSS